MVRGLDGLLRTVQDRQSTGAATAERRLQGRPDVSTTFYII